MKLSDILEVTVKRKRVVRKGKVIRRKVCRPGYKLVNGRCVRQSASERIKRKRGAIRGNRISKTARKRTRKRSMRVRSRRGL